MLPSGPAAIPRGWAAAVIPAENSVTTPAGVIRPMRPGELGEPEVVVGAARVMPWGSEPGVIPAVNSRDHARPA